MKICIIPQKIILIVLAICFITGLSICSSIAFTNQKNDIVENIVNSEFQNKINDLFHSDEKIAYLTFDDGPTTKVTPKVLDILKKYEIKATFFVVGKHVAENPKIIKRAYEEGHYIANHTYTHNNKIYQSNEILINEIKNTDREIGKAIGKEEYFSRLFRFPNGLNSRKFKKEKKGALKVLSINDYACIDWNCLTKDSERKYSNAELIRNLKKSAKNKGTLVILMHDTGDVNNTYDVLEECIIYLKEEGYQFENFFHLTEK